MANSRESFRPCDPGFEEWVKNIIEAEESEFSDCEDDVVHPDFVSDHDSTSEIDASDDEDVSNEQPAEEERNDDVDKSDEDYDSDFDRSDDDSDDYESDDDESVVSDQPPPKKKKYNIVKRYYIGKNKFKWNKKSPDTRTRTRLHNLISHLPGVIGPAKQLGAYCTQRSAWELLFPDEILEEVILRSNQKLAEIRHFLTDHNKHEYKDLNLLEFKAFLGVLMYSAIFKSNNEDLESVFATDGTGRDIFRSTISLRRIQTLLICLRFDNAANREERKQMDPTSAISWVFEKFLANCQQCYSIGEYACIDEMLIGFRGKCKFCMYMPNKPRKYGIKMMVLSDAKTQYFFNGYIYSGKDSDGINLSNTEKKLAKPTQSVIRLAAPIVQTNRNITADNWFTSIELVKELRTRGLTYVGTIRKNKREIPQEFLPSKEKAVNSAMYGFTNDITLVSFVPKIKKAVLLVSSMHHKDLSDKESGKPEIVEFYNSTKGGVDALDEKCVIYSTARRTNRWPMAIFFQLLNISLVNSYIIYSSFRGNVPQKRFDFVKSLARDLVEPQLNLRLMNKRLPRVLRQTIGRILDKQVPIEVNTIKGGQVRCGMCPRSKDKKTKTRCSMCQIPICATCTSTICEECLK